MPLDGHQQKHLQFHHQGIHVHVHVLPLDRQSPLFCLSLTDASVDLPRARVRGEAVLHRQLRAFPRLERQEQETAGARSH